MDLPDFFGLDIGNHTIKLAEVDRKSIDQAKLNKVASIETPYGVLSKDDKESHKKISDRIIELVESSGVKTKKCVAALPEASIFTRLINLPKVEESKLEELVHWEARQYIPLPLSEVQKDYIIVEEKNVNGKVMLQLLLVAAPKLLVNKYIEIVKNAGLDLLAVETETIATSRLVSFGAVHSGAVLILDFGAQGTDMSVIRNGNMIFSQSLSTGSDALTKAISNDFNLEMAKAEQYKIAYGLDASQIDGKISKSLEPIMQIISDEVVKTLDFFRTHLRDSIPQKILLVGDGAKLKKLDTYIASKIGIPVERANPYEKFEMSNQVKENIKIEDLVGYSVAVGLGLKTS